MKCFHVLELVLFADLCNFFRTRWVDYYKRFVLKPYKNYKHLTVHTFTRLSIDIPFKVVYYLHDFMTSVSKISNISEPLPWALLQQVKSVYWRSNTLASSLPEITVPLYNYINMYCKFRYTSPKFLIAPKILLTSLRFCSHVSHRFSSKKTKMRNTCCTVRLFYIIWDRQITTHTKSIFHSNML